MVAEEIEGGQALLVCLDAGGVGDGVGVGVFDLFDGDFDLEVQLCCIQAIRVNGQLRKQENMKEEERKPGTYQMVGRN